MSDFCIFRGGSVKMNSNYFLNCLNAEGNSLPPHFRSVFDDESVNMYCSVQLNNWCRIGTLHGCK